MMMMMMMMMIWNVSDDAVCGIGPRGSISRRGSRCSTARHHSLEKHPVELLGDDRNSGAHIIMFDAKWPCFTTLSNLTPGNGKQFTLGLHPKREAVYSHQPIVEVLLLLLMAELLPMYGRDKTPISTGAGFEGPPTLLVTGGLCLVYDQHHALQQAYVVPFSCCLGQLRTAGLGEAVHKLKKVLNERG